MGTRTTLGDALHQAGQRADALAHFRKAEAMQAERQPTYPLLYSQQGFLYCDLLLAGPERAVWRATGAGVTAAGGRKSRQDAGALSGLVQTCRDAEQRAAQTLDWITGQQWLLDIALDHLTLGRANLYRGILERPDPADDPEESALESRNPRSNRPSTASAALLSLSSLLAACSLAPGCVP